MEITTWLGAKDKNYKEGVNLFKQNGGNLVFVKYFESIENAQPQSQHFKMLISKLENIVRKQKQGIPIKKEQIKPAIEIKEIKIKPKLNTQTNTDALRTKGKYINKILVLEYEDLEEKDKAIFFNNKDYFLKKKNLFIENANRERELKILHADLKRAVMKDDKASIIKELKEKEEANVKNWEIIDNWEQPTIDESNKSDVIIKKTQRLELLKNYIRREKLKMGNPSTHGKKKEAASKRLTEYLAEMEQLKTELNVN